MFKNKLLFLVGLSFVLILSLVFADGNDSTNLTGNRTNDNMTNITVVLKNEIEIIKFFPKEFKLGDVQFNIQVKNNLNESLEGVAASISGRGFSTYDIVPIDFLGPFEKDYIFVNGNFKETGNINLSVRIENNIFYQEVSIVDVNAGKDIEEIKKQEKIEKLANLSRELEVLKKDYANLEIGLSEKKDSNYDVSKISLDDLKKYIRSIETDILYENIESARVNLEVAREEYDYQNTKLSSSKVVPFVTRLKDNALIVSAIVGSILATIALTEIIRKQSSHVITKVTKGTQKKKKRKKK